MKTFVLFLFTCFLSTGCLVGALYANRPWYCYGAAAAVILLFGRYSIRRQRREEARRRMENFFLMQFRKSRR